MAASRLGRWLGNRAAGVLAWAALGVTLLSSSAGAQPPLGSEAWLSFRNTALPRYGLWAMLAVAGLSGVFFLLRGRIRIEHGWAGRTITRFSGAERFGHWLLATSFLILALTGLNVVYGRYVLLPLIGAEAFSLVSIWGQWLHVHVAFAFMVGLALTFLAWLRHSGPSWRDVVWLAMGGGLVKGLHPPAWKFDAGQKALFWTVMVGGVGLSLTGLALMWPSYSTLFARTFAAIDALGAYVGLAPGLGTQLTQAQEMHYAGAWHAILAFALIVVVIAHTCLRTLGIQGAFSAMGSGQVDVNWARQHHSLWAERELQRMEEFAAAETEAARAAPAE